MSLAQVLGKLTPILSEYATQLKTTEDRIKLQGTISHDICVKCSQRNIVRVEKFGAESLGGLDSFLTWLKDNNVRDLVSTGKSVEFRSSQLELDGIKGTKITLFEGVGLGFTSRTEEMEYAYRIPFSKLKNKTFAGFLTRPFSELRVCAHLSEVSAEKHLAYVGTTSRHNMFDRHQRVEDLWERGETSQRYELLCEECFKRIDSIGCEESIRKEGFTYAHRCPTQKIIFENLLAKQGIRCVPGQTERTSLGSIGLMTYLPDLGVFASDSLAGLEEAVEALKPDTILVLQRKQSLPRFLEFDTNVILFDPEAEKDPILVYDRNRVVEKFEETLIDAVLENLDEYSSEVRGKEHDRLTAAFERIGKELGFIPQTEMALKGARVDVVWLGDKGKVEVAIEVETSAQWKKDIVTTWETSPRLAIVLAHFKTEKAVDDIVQYSLLQQMPHRLLFIGYTQKKAYLIERGVILKSYNVRLAS